MKNIYKTGKRIGAGMLAAAVLLSSSLLNPASVSAKLIWDGPLQDDSVYPGAEYAEDENHYIYVFPKGTTTKKGATIDGYLGPSRDIKLPAKADQYKLTNIGTGFVVVADIATITVPTGYTTIDSQAFKDMKNLYRISIPASVTNIADDAFSGCNPDKLTIVAPYGSVAEQYAAAHGFHYSNSTAVKLLSNGTSMYAGEQKKFAVLNSDKSVIWKSADTSVAAVDANGLVRAKKAGSAKISATVGGKTYSCTIKVVKRTQANVLNVIWNQSVTSYMSDYDRAVAAEQWVAAHIDASGSSSSVKTALEKGKVNYTGRANTYKKILEHYGLKVNVVKGSRHVENSVVIAGKTYKVSALSTVPAADRNYTTTTLGLAINKSTMNLSVGGTGTFKTLGTTKKVTYSSSNKKVATVTAGGKVTAKGAGTATVTMKMGTKSYKLRVRVNK